MSGFTHALINMNDMTQSCWNALQAVSPYELFEYMPHSLSFQKLLNCDKWAKTSCLPVPVTALVRILGGGSSHDPPSWLSKSAMFSSGCFPPALDFFRLSHLVNTSETGTCNYSAQPVLPLSTLCRIKRNTPRPVAMHFKSNDVKKRTSNHTSNQKHTCKMQNQ
jgi:hypothetical protein